jgi:hypothetical chaperone protein
MTVAAIGLDFGTANSALAIARPDGSTELGEFSDGPGRTSTFKSIIYFGPKTKGLQEVPHVVAGPEAVRSYLDADHRGRLIQSVKSFLPSPSFSNTQIFGRTYTLEELIAIIIRNMRDSAIAQFGQLAGRVVVGRPVCFAGAEDHDGELLALRRLRSAVEMAGFKEIAFEFEPIAAAYQYEVGLDHDELVLIGDFGGGTSDFSLLRLGPSRKSRGRGRQDILGSEGAAIAGDTFDGRIVRNLVAPKLGLGTHYYSLGKEFPVPAWLFSMLERWHLVSFLKTPKTLKVIRDVRVSAQEPRKLDALYHLIQEDLGYDLFRAVELTKVTLSQDESSQFVFQDSSADMYDSVRREEFERWIRADIQALVTSVNKLLDRCGIGVRDVDTVFLTGGSSFVPAVRYVFESMFGSGRIKSGGELTSVAKGLALCAAE